MTKTQTKPAWSARCNCYDGHNSASGRCHARNVTDPTRHEGQAAICEACRAGCPAGSGDRKAVTDERMAEAVDRIRERMACRNGRITWSLEMGRGETYRNQDWTLYALDRYERSSVLYGRERRTWVWDFGPGEAGKQAAREALKAAGIRKWEEDASSYVPVDQIVSHLPDDTDY